jgi:hypothetical protein
VKNMTDKFKDLQGVLIQGHIHIYDPVEKYTYVDKRNASHYENMSISLAESLANAGRGPIYKMAFGNGGTSVDPTGIITYLTPNSTGVNASLYNQTFSKVVDDQAGNNIDPDRNIADNNAYFPLTTSGLFTISSIISFDVCDFKDSLIFC